MSEELKEDKLAEIVIDFNEIRGKEINESWLHMFGSWTKSIGCVSCLIVIVLGPSAAAF